jgi:hypothetical protein
MHICNKFCEIEIQHAMDMNTVRMVMKNLHKKREGSDEQLNLDEEMKRMTLMANQARQGWTTRTLGS